LSGYFCASAALWPSFEQLVAVADRVVIAEVVEISPSTWGPKKMRIYKSYTFEVDQEVAGNGLRRFSIVQPGGRIGNLAQRTDGYPKFARGEKLLLFLEKHVGDFRVVGLCQGVFGFHIDEQRQIIYQRLSGLSFPKDPGRPILLERDEAIRRIRELFQAKQVSP
ncbi:MAG: hypothetical protein JRJ19_10225, partial [Deltaproteobacteria bacterium]|nr:hypothetical protein [Deltaproteobacteria bacterium]